jgi:hypothetical protein
LKAYILNHGAGLQGVCDVKVIMKRMIMSNVISMAILFSYFYHLCPRKKKEQNKHHSNGQIGILHVCGSYVYFPLDKALVKVICIISNI